ncbi:hypothetical protein [Thalassomonas haliotis]|uniref:Uncharacterized protein n=1 Tax=Thalassomonas haliotis TaxID=485448 RepID=A0ABY7VD98_9GAMM|nr:hypothetical protein [Thalassomonas haliotis]WDE10872.1 hypothetical protein H3N35_21895 [Thalassomonas haliotis]
MYHFDSGTAVLENLKQPEEQFAYSLAINLGGSCGFIADGAGLSGFDRQYLCG